MTGAFLPGNSSVELRNAPVGERDHGEVLLSMSLVCGPGVCCPYRKHLGRYAEGQTMTGAYLPGNSTVELRNAPVGERDHGEVLLSMYLVCGPGVCCPYRKHLGRYAEDKQ